MNIVTSIVLGPKSWAKVTTVSPPGRDSRDSRSSRLAEATQKALGTSAPLNCFWYIYLVPSPHLSNIYKIVFLKSFAVIIILSPF